MTTMAEHFVVRKDGREQRRFESVERAVGFICDRTGLTYDHVWDETHGGQLVDAVGDEWTIDLEPDEPEPFVDVVARAMAAYPAYGYRRILGVVEKWGRPSTETGVRWAMREVRNRKGA